MDSGLLLDLSDEFEADPEWRNSFMDVFSMWEFDGIEGVYGVPFTYFATVLYCNTELFEQYNLEIPKTIAEFEAVCDAFVKAGVTPIPRYGEGWRWAHWATGMVMQKYGQQLIYDLANRTKKYTDEEMMSIAQMFLDWQAKAISAEHRLFGGERDRAAFVFHRQVPMIAIGPCQPENIAMKTRPLDKVEVAVSLTLTSSRTDQRQHGGPTRSVHHQEGPGHTAARRAAEAPDQRPRPCRRCGNPRPTPPLPSPPPSNRTT